MLLRPADTGITFTNRLAEERSLTNQVFLNGSGVACGDVTGDGLPDLYFCGLDGPNALYRNLGQGRFEDITAAAGVACTDQASTGAAFADLDGDGHLDLLVTGLFRGVRLFLNEGTGRFREATAGSGLESTAASTSLALADVDGDGLLDLYVVNYRNDTLRDLPGTSFTFGVTNGVRQLLTVNGRSAAAPDLAGRFTFDEAGGVLENGEPDTLFRNLGQARFEAIPWTGGAFRDERGRPVETPHDWGLSAMFRDLNRDGAPDLYVCNDFQSPDRIWINDGNGRFQAIVRSAIRETSLFSMGVDFADIDRDGHDDLFVADMLSREHVRRQVQVMGTTAMSQSRLGDGARPQVPRNTLFRNRGDVTFAEIARLAGVEASDWTWSAIFLDVDLDGFEDLLTSTGHGRDAQDADAARDVERLLEQRRLGPRDQLRARSRFPRLDTPNYAFRNRRDWSFEEVGGAWGFDSRRITHGMALVDLDQDGDLDVVANCLNDAPLILRNDAAAPRIAVRLRGWPPNTRGIGARIHVRAPGLPDQSQEMIAGGRYLSSDEPLRTFAAPRSGAVNIEVEWRSGRRSLLSGVPTGHAYEIDERDAGPPLKPPGSTVRPFFEDRSRLLGHQHVDEPFDDFDRQPLLPHALSHAGPAVMWFDFNGDQWEDLLVGAGRGGRVAVFRNDGQGGFVPQRSALLQTPAELDFGGLLGWRTGPDQSLLLLGMDTWEMASPEAARAATSLRQISLATGQVEDLPLSQAGSTGPLALGDLDLDGHLDLFVGGRALPGRHPEPVASSLLQLRDGRLTPHPMAGSALDEVGPVNGAVITDLQGDGQPLLVLATAWGPIRMFRHVTNALVPWDPPVHPAAEAPLLRAPVALSALTGWWNSVAAGDFDGDGRLDLIAGNWGRNTSRHPTPDQPLRLHFGETAGTPGLALIESQQDPVLGYEVPLRHRALLGESFPSLLEAYPTFTAFARAGLDSILASGLPALNQRDCATLDSVLLLNRGGSFEVSPLPTEAQIAPVFGIAVGDFDGDGHLDVFLAQNFGHTHPADSPHRAGTGTWLRGDGRGGLQAVHPDASGIRLDGDGRGAAACDFDHDGRLDLVIGQNRGVTALYRNVLGTPGLRVLLRGPASNPQAIGAQVRAAYRDGTLGPVHEIRSGGGYWSQEPPTLLLARPDAIGKVRVRWPDGTRQDADPPADGLKLELTHP